MSFESDSKQKTLPAIPQEPDRVPKLCVWAEIASVFGRLYRGDSLSKEALGRDTNREGL